MSPFTTSNKGLITTGTILHAVEADNEGNRPPPQHIIAIKNSDWSPRSDQKLTSEFFLLVPEIHVSEI